MGYKNIGSFILMICKDFAKNNNNNKRYLRLHCVRWNEKLNEIYEKHDFKLIGCGKTDYEYCLRECDLFKKEY